MKRYISLLLILTGVVVFSTAQTAGSGGFRQEGVASWYGKEFEGRPTASGEIFNPNHYTAAHPSLPFGTVLTITNKQNMRQVSVRVNDRGPFVAARIIDLSRAAAESLDMIISGTAQVIVEQAQNAALGPVPNTASPAPVVMQAPVITAPQTNPNVPVFDDNSPRIINFEPEVAAAPPATQVEVPVRIESTPVEASPRIERDLFADQPRQEVAASSQPVLDVEIVNVLPDAPQVETRIAYNAPAAVVIGGMPSAESNKYYRLQVGSFKVPRNAVNAFDALKSAGLKPSVEQYGDFFRIVLSDIRARDIPSIAQTLGNSGFREVLVREELD